MRPERARPARARIVLAALSLTAGAAGCGGCGRERVSGVDAGAEPGDARPAPATSAAGALPARCTATTAERELEGGASLEVGDAQLTASGLWLSATLVRGGARVGVVFQTDLALGQARLVELGELAGGELAPRLFALEGAPPTTVLVASYARGAAPRTLGNRPGAARVVATRTLAVAELGAGSVTPLFRLDQQADDSMAFDLVLTGKSSGFIAWDEDSDRVVRGVVKVAPFADGKLKADAVVTATPYETDADSPRLTRTAGGDVLLGWLARDVLGDDAGAEPDADKQGAYLETSGEERARQWVELATLDPAGKPTGALLSITARSKSHTSSFELGSAQDGADVYLYDAVLRGESQGARVLRVPVRGRRALAAEELLDGGVGAAPTFLGGGLVAFVDLAERSMLFVPGGARQLTREPLARGGRFVASAAGSLYSVAVEPGADGGPGRAVLRRHACP